MDPKKRPTTKSATRGGAKRAKANHTSATARSQKSQKQTKRHSTQLKQSCTSSSPSQSSTALSPRMDEVHCRLSRLIEQAKEHMEFGRRLSEEWVSCEAEVEDMEQVTTKVDDERLLMLRRQLDDVNTIMSGEFCASDDDSSDGF